MKDRGITFVGTRTGAAAEMTAFARNVLGLAPRSADGTSFFDLPDGSSFAAQQSDDEGAQERTVGFLVDDLTSAVQALQAAGVLTDAPATTDVHRYVHFRAPDGHLYELVEELDERR